MSLRENLDKIANDYASDLRQVEKFSLETHEQLLQRFEKPTVSAAVERLPETEKKSFEHELQQAINKIITHDFDFEMPNLVYRTLWAELNDHAMTRRLGFISEMTLIYVVALMEALIKEYLITCSLISTT